MSSMQLVFVDRVIIIYANLENAAEEKVEFWVLYDYYFLICYSLPNLFPDSIFFVLQCLFILCASFDVLNDN